MLRCSLGVTIMDNIRNEYIRRTAQVGKFGEKTREARLRWYGHLRRKNESTGRMEWVEKNVRNDLRQESTS